MTTANQSFNTAEQLNKMNHNGYADMKGMTSITGKEESDIRMSSIGGIVGGLLGAAAAYNEGFTPVAVIAGAVVGGATGYAVGNIVGLAEEAGTSGAILGTVAATLFGASVSITVAQLVNAATSASVNGL